MLALFLTRHLAAIYEHNLMYVIIIWDWPGLNTLKMGAGLILPDKC
jgi:hypothetical protein